MAAVHLAKALGLRVIGTASTEQGLQAVHHQGADLVFNHKQEGYLDDIAVSDRSPLRYAMQMLIDLS